MRVGEQLNELIKVQGKNRSSFDEKISTVSNVINGGGRVTTLEKLASQVGYDVQLIPKK